MILKPRSKPPARIGPTTPTTPKKRAKKSVRLHPFVKSFPLLPRSKKCQQSPKKTTALSKSAFATSMVTS